MILDKYRIFWETLLRYNNMEFNPRKFVTYVIVGSICVGAAFSILLPFEGYLRIILFIIGIMVAHIVLYAHLLLSGNSRAAKVEEVLPDFLSLVASNIRSGLTPDKALIISARDEFGPLTEAINKAGKSSITGMPLDQVMMGMTEHIRSTVLEKTMVMIVEGLHSGGDMAELMERTALDIRKFRSVRREVNSIILNYVLFIVAAITGGAPLLYGVSTFLVDIMVLIKSKIGTDAETMSSLSSNVSIFKGQLLLTPEAVALFSASAIFVTVFFGCMAVGVMMSGKKMDGLKYFPILFLVALAILFGIRFGLSLVLGSMLI